MWWEAILSVVFYGDFKKNISIFAKIGIFGILNFDEKNTCFQLMGE